MTTTTRKRTLFTTHQLQDEIRQQRVWIDEHGHDEAGYVERYGSKSDPDRFGNGGEAIYAADHGRLLQLEERLLQRNKIAMTRNNTNYTVEQVALAHNAAIDLLRALKVLVTTRETRAYLVEHDPQALKQALVAVQLATGICGVQEGNDAGGETCARALGHTGKHEDRNGAQWT